MGTVYGTRSVGDVVVQLEDAELGSHAALFCPFVAVDTFRVPEPGVPGFPAGTAVRVQDRGYAPCPCCGGVMAHVRGAGLGVIECRSAGVFYLYEHGPDAPRLCPSPAPQAPPSSG